MRGNELLDKMDLIDSKYIEAAEVATAKRKIIKWPKFVAIAACICLLLTATFNLIPMKKTIDNPLIITAYAAGLDGSSIPTNLAIGERIQLSSSNFYLDDYYKWFAFDLTLVEGMYLQLSSVDENWNLILDKEIHYSGDIPKTPYWALTEGSDIAIIGTDLNGDVLQAYKDGTAKPRFKDNSMLWRPNDEGINRCIIQCFDSQFKRVVSYYLEITEDSGVYFAEIIKTA